MKLEGKYFLESPPEWKQHSKNFPDRLTKPWARNLTNYELYKTYKTLRWNVMLTKIEGAVLNCCICGSWLCSDRKLIQCFLNDHIHIYHNRLNFKFLRKINFIVQWYVFHSEVKAYEPILILFLCMHMCTETQKLMCSLDSKKWRLSVKWTNSLLYNKAK